MRTPRRLASTILTLSLALALLATAALAQAPKNVILLIGDGMGVEQVKAAALYATGRPEGLAFEAYRVGRATTDSLTSRGKPKLATDSAAAGTALATGAKTNNGVISQAPDGRDLPTVLEVLARTGKLTGLVTTVPMTHATPASFGAHTAKRTQYAEIATAYFTGSRPNVLFGAVVAGGKGVTEPGARDAGYTVVRTRDELQTFTQTAAKSAAGPADLHVSGQFAPDMLPWEYTGPLPPDPEKKRKYPDHADVTYETAPHLSEMTRAALRLLERGPSGFFLMIEGGAIDWACHDNCIERCVGETLEFDRAFQAVMDWAKGRTDTLVIVTADHETGGLKVVAGRGKGAMPEVAWSSGGHTPAAVPVYAWGPGADRLKGAIDNTALFGVMTGRATPAAAEAAAQ